MARFTEITSLSKVNAHVVSHSWWTTLRSYGHWSTCLWRPSTTTFCWRQRGHLAEIFHLWNNNNCGAVTEQKRWNTCHIDRWICISTSTWSMVFHATAIVRHYDPYARSRGNGERTPSDDLRPSWTTLQAHLCLKPPALALATVEYSVILTIFTVLHASHAHGLAMRKLSVCLSNAWIVTKRKNVLPRLLYHMKERLS